MDNLLRPPSFVLRPAHNGEGAAIAALVNSAYRGESSRAGWTTEADLLGGQRTDSEAVEEMLASPSCTLLVAEGTGRLAGCVLLEKQPGGVAYLGMLTVDPFLQAQGLGKRLLQAAEEYASREWAAMSVEMTVIRQRRELIAWYERRGYAPTGETRPFPVEDARFGLPQVPDLEFVVLRKHLQAAT